MDLICHKIVDKNGSEEGHINIGIRCFCFGPFRFWHWWELETQASTSPLTPVRKMRFRINCRVLAVSKWPAAMLLWSIFKSFWNFRNKVDYLYWTVSVNYLAVNTVIYYSSVLKLPITYQISWVFKSFDLRGWLWEINQLRISQMCNHLSVP